MKFCKPSNKVRFYWLESTGKSVSIKALVDAEWELANCGQEVSWVKAGNKISCYNLGAVTSVWFQLLYKMRKKSTKVCEEVKKSCSSRVKSTLPKNKEYESYSLKH